MNDALTFQGAVAFTVFLALPLALAVAVYIHRTGRRGGRPVDTNQRANERR